MHTAADSRLVHSLFTATHHWSEWTLTNSLYKAKYTLRIKTTASLKWKRIKILLTCIGLFVSEYRAEDVLLLLLLVYKNVCYTFAHMACKTRKGHTTMAVQVFQWKVVRLCPSMSPLSVFLEPTPSLLTHCCVGSQFLLYIYWQVFPLWESTAALLMPHFVDWLT